MSGGPSAEATKNLLLRAFLRTHSKDIRIRKVLAGEDSRPSSDSDAAAGSTTPNARDTGVPGLVEPGGSESTALGNAQTPPVRYSRSGQGDLCLLASQPLSDYDSLLPGEGHSELAIGKIEPKSAVSKLAKASRKNRPTRSVTFYEDGSAVEVTRSYPTDQK